MRRHSRARCDHRLSCWRRAVAGATARTAWRNQFGAPARDRPARDRASAPRSARQAERTGTQEPYRITEVEHQPPGRSERRRRHRERLYRQPICRRTGIRFCWNGQCQGQPPADQGGLWSADRREGDQRASLRSAAWISPNAPSCARRSRTSRRPSATRWRRLWRRQYRNDCVGYRSVVVESGR